MSWSALAAPRQLLWWCVTCDFIAKDSQAHLTPHEEKSRYAQHRNGDAGHQIFLKPAFEAVLRHAEVGANGVDWGSGPVPVLARMLSEASYPCLAYDRYFSPDVEIESASLDFVTCTEVVEHFREPEAEWDRMLAPLRPGGLLVVMTERHRGVHFCADWYYRRDPTHVGFYSEHCLRRLALRKNFEVLEFESRTVVLRRL